MNTHRIPVDGGHVLYVEEHGNPAGLPALVLHGGPGSGCSPLLRSHFDPSRYRILCPDQRGAGRSTPRGSIAANTLQYLLDDLRTLKTCLGVRQWLVVGGSWGATLASAHAIDMPEAVAGLLLRNVFLARKSDVAAFFDRGLREGEDGWRDLLRQATIEGQAPQDFLARVFATGTRESQRNAARYWFRWERQLSGAAAAGDVSDGALDELVDRYRVQSHYLAHQCWLANPPLLQMCSSPPAVPMLLLHGTMDAVCPPEGASALAEVLGEHATLRWIDGAGHDPTHPAMAAAMQSALRTFACRGDVLQAQTGC